MNHRKLIHFFLLNAGLGLILFPQTVSACAACFGKSDSELALGMNMGIFSLLGVVVCVLGGIASFFIYLARRAAIMPTAPGNNVPLETTNKA
jgi:hypothetical protein